MAFNNKPDNDNFDYFGRGETDYGVELPTWADTKLIGRHIDFEDGAIEVN